MIAYDPDIKDRNADQHIAYFIVKEDQQPLIGIDKSGCMTLKKPLDRDGPLGYSMWTVSFLSTVPSILVSSSTLSISRCKAEKTINRMARESTVLRCSRDLVHIVNIAMSTSHRYFIHFVHDAHFLP